jgi:hypothetical protein
MAFLRSTDWVLPGVLLSYFVGMHYPAFFWGRAAAARSSSLCNFYLLLYLFRNEDSSGGVETTWLLFGRVNKFIRVYATAEAHDRQRTLDVEVWVAGKNL